MIKIEKTTVYGFREAIRGMRNPMESHDKSDSMFGTLGTAWIGPNDEELMRKLARAGTEHSKYRRTIVVYCDITAPLYWWKEFDTYKIGTVVNSYSTMHKIHAHEFTMDMFSHEHLLTLNDPGGETNTEVSIRNRENLNEYDVALLATDPLDILRITVDTLNIYRRRYLRTKESAPEEAKRYWWQMIQLLPSSYNQTRTVMSNYEVLAAIWRQRKAHKQDEWRIGFMEWIQSLPYNWIITGGNTDAR